jgi:ribulose-bisphosphate carboxylase large chain
MSKKMQDYSTCEIPLNQKNKSDNRNRFYSFQDDFTWKGVRIQKYKPGDGDWSEIVRQVLIGAKGESTKFHLRYFEIQPGGYSSFETHKHEHVVIGIRGKGRVRLNRKNIDIKFLDVLYIAPNTPHRFYNPYDRPFGFFCIVNAKRDRPKPVKR